MTAFSLHPAALALARPSDIRGVIRKSLVLIGLVAPPAAGQRDTLTTDSAAARHASGRFDAGTAATRAVVPTLTELLVGRHPGLDIVRPSSSLGVGGLLRMRGVRSLGLSSDPVIEIDGQILPATAGRQETPSFNGVSSQLGGQSFLDLLDPEDIESIEIVPGLAGALALAPNAVNGAIRITTRRGRAGKTRWRASTEFGLSRDASDYGTVYFGYDPANPRFSCGLLAEVQARCAVSQIYSKRPTDDPDLSVLATGYRRKAGVSASGSSGRFRYYASARFVNETGVIRLPAKEQEFLRNRIGASTLSDDRVLANRLSDISAQANVDVAIRRNLDFSVSAATASERPRLPSALRSVQPGQFFEAMWYARAAPGDTNYYSPGHPATVFDYSTEERINRTNALATVRWRPSPRLTGWVRFGHSRASVRDALATEDTTHRRIDLGGGRDTIIVQRFRQMDNSLGHDRSSQLDAGVALTAPLGSALTLRSSAMVQYRRRTVERQYEFRSMSDDLEATATGGTDLPARTLGLVLGGNLSIASAASVFITGRRDRPKILDSAFVGLTAFTAGGHWRVAGTDAGSRLLVRGSVARVERMPGIEEGLAFVFLPIGSPLPHPATERIREVELGGELAFRNRATVGVTWYQQRLTEGYAPTVLFPGIPVVSGVGAVVRSSGVEALLAVPLLDRRDIRWDVTANVGFRSGRIDSLAVPDAFGPEGSCNRVGAAPHSLCAPRQPRATDRNGNGVLEPSEMPPQGPFEPAASSLPRRTGALGSWIRLAGLGGRWEIGGQLDYAGGFERADYLEAIRCLFAVCESVVVPGSPIEKQERALVASVFAGYLANASYLRWREMTVSYQPTIRWLGGRRLTLGITGRNLATLTSFPGIDPEIGISGDLFGLGLPQPGLHRSVTVRLAVDW